MKKTAGEKVFYYINCIIITLIAFTALYPFWYVLVASISASDAVVTGQVVFWPKGLNLEAYIKVLSERGIWNAYGNTIYYTVVGTLVNMFFTVCGAYPLSKRRLMGRNLFSFFIALSLWFSAGIIPMYLNFRDLGLIDNRAGIIFGFAVQTFYVILMRTYFQSIPEAVEESATIDGANDLQILVQIYLPLSIPMLATIALYYAVERWNGYFWAMILFKSEQKVPLQVLLTKLIVQMQGYEDAVHTVDTFAYSMETIVYATIIVTIVPILLVFPFLQKYFIKGIMIGSVKG